MTDVIERIRVVSEYTTLSLLIWRRFQKPMPGLAEDTLARNPGLGDLGEFIPVGTEVLMKIEAPQTAQTQVQEPIRLW